MKEVPHVRTLNATALLSTRKRSWSRADHQQLSISLSVYSWRGRIVATTHDISGANDSWRLFLMPLALVVPLQSLVKHSGDERVVGRHIFLLDAVNRGGLFVLECFCRPVAICEMHKSKFSKLARKQYRAENTPTSFKRTKGDRNTKQPLT
jgi:hypothetical protein